MICGNIYRVYPEQENCAEVLIAGFMQSCQLSLSAKLYFHGTPHQHRMSVEAYVYLISSPVPH